MRRFPSRDLIDRGIIRMHEQKTCEIVLLSCFNLSVWSAKTSMLDMQTHLVNSPKETWPTKDSYAVRCFKSSLLAKIYPWPFGQASAWGEPGKLPPQISSTLTIFCYVSKSSKASFRLAGLIGRWSFFLLSKKTLGFISHGSQVLYRESSCLLRPCSSTAKRKCRKMAAGLGDYSLKNQSPNTRFGRRQFERYETNRPTRRMGPSALSFSFDSKIPSSTSPTKTDLERRSCARGDLSVDTSNPRNCQWPPTQHVNYSTDSTSSKSAYSISNSSCDARVPLIHKLLQNVSNLPGTQSTLHDQHYRIDELHYPGFIAQKPLGFQSSIALAMGNSTDSITKAIKLQWQISSTDLINPTPNSDRQD